MSKITVCKRPSLSNTRASLKIIKMSVNYASALSPYEHKGRCGMPEKFEEPQVVAEKSVQLAEMIRGSQHVVVITGAGISTSAGIPDFRGPTGVWTLEQKGRSPDTNITFETARPTITHLALVALEQAGYIKYLISQNVDGLHLRSGFPRSRLAELHGNMFVEECDLCKMQYIRSKPVPTMTLQLTGGVCTQVKQRGKCRGRLRDTILDWEDSLPTFELEQADKHCRQADLCLCLGTSLQIMPCGNMPMLTKKNAGRIVVVNLQTTRLDKHADLRLHARVDDVMLQVCKSLGVSLPEWKQPLIVLKSEYTTSEELPPRVTVGDSESCDIVVSSKDKPASNLDDVKCNAEPKEIAVKTEQLSGAFNEHKGAQLADGCKQNGHNQSSKACEYQAPSGTLLECSQTYSQEVGAENSSCWTASCCDDDAVQGVKRKHEGDDVA